MQTLAHMGWSPSPMARAGDLLLELPLACREALDTELGEVAAHIDAARLPVAGLTVAPAAYLRSYHPSAPWPDGPSFTDIYRAARSAFPGLPGGGGVHAYFPELNRARPPMEGCDYVSFCTSPIVHAADERSIAQSLEALPAIMETRDPFAAACRSASAPPPSGCATIPIGRGPVANPGNGRIPMARIHPCPGLGRRSLADRVPLRRAGRSRRFHRRLRM